MERNDKWKDMIKVWREWIKIWKEMIKMVERNGWKQVGEMQRGGAVVVGQCQSQ